MRLIKKGSVGSDVIRLCQLLNIPEQQEFTEYIKTSVIDIQKKYNLNPDGIVGNMTWLILLVDNRLRYDKSQDITENDYRWASEYLGCDTASIKSVKEVETGGRSGFVLPNKPQILFEGHLFWKNLKKEGINPEPLQKQFPNLVYPKWTRQYYESGIKEYNRFDKACTISRIAAIKSTSFGLFQILGSNYESCYCKTVNNFYELMCKSQLCQFILGIIFIKTQKLDKYLNRHDWVSFAERYNGPLQEQNHYSEKLEKYWKNFNN